MSRYQFGIASISMGTAFAIGGCFLISAFVYLDRTFTGSVNPFYHAIETLVTLGIVIDAMLRWGYSVTRGLTYVLVDAINGQLAIDVLICTSFITLALQDPVSGKQSWFSFAFLSAVRLQRTVSALERLDSSKYSWRRHIVYHILHIVFYVYTAGCIIMLFEVLGPSPWPASEDHLSGQQKPWSTSEAFQWGFSTMILLGDSARTAQTGLGQIAALAFSLASVIHVIFRIFPAAWRWLTGNEFYASFRRGALPHLLVVGTPSAAMLWDFLTELYHPNHFSDMSRFDAEAPDIVIMTPTEKTLLHLTRFLGLRAALLWRHKVTLLVGEVFDDNDQKRACLKDARRIFVLPNFTASDVFTEDAKNIMRSFAVSAVAPHIRVDCLLHTSESRLAVEKGQREDSGLQFHSIDSMKLLLMAKACIIRGGCALICNLCRTMVNTGDAGKKPWQIDYDKSLDIEVYQVRLSSMYHGCFFLEIFEDILIRSEGTVQLIGIVEFSKKGAALISINPASSQPLDLRSETACGVFLAPDLGAIVQRNPGEEMESREILSLDGFAPFARQASRSRARKSTMMEGGHRRNSAASLGVASLNGIIDVAEGDDSQEMEKLAQQRFDASMATIKHTLMRSGLPPDVIGDATEVKAEAAFKKDDNEKELEDQTLLHGMNEDEQDTEEVEDEWAAEVMKVSDPDSKKQDLEKLDAIWQNMEKLCHQRTTRAPRDVTEKGGHIILCLVRDSTCGEDHLGAQPWRLGKSAGLEAFLAPLRDKQINQSQELEIPVLVLAEQLPSDWHVVVSKRKVYFVKGSALCLEDLRKCCFTTARAIAIARCHAGSMPGVTKAEDSRVVLAAWLIEKNLPMGSSTIVVTDHAMGSTPGFLPSDGVTEDADYKAPRLAAGIVGSAAELPRALTALSKGKKAIAKSGKLTGGSGETVDEDFNELQSCVHDEDFEDLETNDYAWHLRYMRGQVFMTSMMTCMMANSLYNPSLLWLIPVIAAAPMALIPLPAMWEKRLFGDFAIWLLREKGLLSVALYRSATASIASFLGKPLDSSVPTHHFVYCVPNGNTCQLVKSDRIICIAQQERHGKHTRIQTSAMAPSSSPAGRSSNMEPYSSHATEMTRKSSVIHSMQSLRTSKTSKKISRILPATE